MTEPAMLRPSDRLRICVMSIPGDDDEVTLNKVAAEALLDEVRQIDRMAGQAADMVVDLRNHLDQAIRLIRKANTIATFAVGLAIGFAWVALMALEASR